MAGSGLSGGVSAPMGSVRGDHYSRVNAVRFCSESSGMHVVEAETEFDKALEGPKPVVAYFTATWCGPCRIVSPVVEQLAKIHTGITFLKIDIDTEDLFDVCGEWRVDVVPTIVSIENGKEVGRVRGADVNGIRSLVEDVEQA